MSTIRSICIRCGTFKQFVSESCETCGFAPQSDEDIAKSFLLSTEFDAAEEVLGKSNDELLEISEQIRRGHYEFDANDVQRHLTEYRKVKYTTPRTVIVDLVKWGWPVLILAAVLVLIFVNRR